MCSLGLQDVSCLSDCMGLLHLDLAKNNISDLKDLGRLLGIVKPKFHKQILVEHEKCL